MDVILALAVLGIVIWALYALFSLPKKYKDFSLHDRDQAEMAEYTFLRIKQKEGIMIKKIGVTAVCGLLVLYSYSFATENNFIINFGEMEKGSTGFYVANETTTIPFKLKDSGFRVGFTVKHTLDVVTIAELILPLNELPEDCKTIFGEHGYSVQSRILYQHDELFGRDPSISAENKFYQSIECNGVLATIYYYQYLSRENALRALEHIRVLIWGEKKASVLHPETIFALNNVVVVISSDQPKQFEGLMLDYWKRKFAIADFTQALKLDPGLAEAYYDRGLAYANKGQYDQAISDYNKALEINPREAKAYNNRADAYMLKGQYDQAISDCNKALEIDPKFAIAYITLGQIHSRKGQYDQAILNFDKALELAPKFAVAYYERAIAHCCKANFDKSWQDVNKAQELGFQVPEEFLNELRKASGRQR